MRPTPPELRQRFAEALQSIVSPDWIRRHVLDERTKPQPPAPPEEAPAPDVAGDESPQGDEELPPEEAPPEGAAQVPSPPDGTQPQAPPDAPAPTPEPAPPPGPAAPQDPAPIDATQADPGEYADQPPGKPFMNDGTDKLRADGTTMPEFNRYRQPGPGDKDAVERYLKQNKNPTDDDFHNFARSIGLDPRDAEAIAFRLASKEARDKSKDSTSDKPSGKSEAHEPGSGGHPHDPATAAAAQRYWDLARKSIQAGADIYRGQVTAPAKKGDRPPELGALEKLDREVEGAHGHLLKTARAHLKASGRPEGEAGLHAAMHMPKPEKGEVAHHHTLVSGLINTSGNWDAKSWSTQQLAHLERALDHHYGRKVSINDRGHLGTTPPIHHTEADDELRRRGRTAQTSDSPDAHRARYAALHRTGQLDAHLRDVSSAYIKAHQAHQNAYARWLNARMDPSHPEGPSSEKALNQEAGRLRDAEAAFRKAALHAAEARGAGGAHPGLALQRGDHSAEDHLRALAALHGIHPEIDRSSKALHFTGRDTQAPTTNKFERMPAFLASMKQHYGVAPHNTQKVAHHQLVHFRLPQSSKPAPKTEDTQIDNEGKKSCGVFIPLPTNLARQFPPKPEDDSPVHVTVLYAGNLSPADYQTFCAVVGAVARRYQPIALSMNALDCFETKNKQLIPHMAVTSQGWRLVDGKLVPILAALHAELREAAEKAGLKIEHDYGTDESKRPAAEKFNGHVTLAYLDPAQPYIGPTPTGSWTATDIECWGWERVQLPLGHLVVNQPAVC